jgi:uncharacterized protein DUF3606
VNTSADASTSSLIARKASLRVAPWWVQAWSEALSTLIETGVYEVECAHAACFIAASYRYGYLRGFPGLNFTGEFMAQDQGHKTQADFRVDICSEYELQLWSKEFQCKPHELKEALSQVGTSAKAILVYLGQERERNAARADAIRRVK